MIFSSSSLSLVFSLSLSLTLPAIYSGFTFATPARYKEDSLFSLSLRRGEKPLSFLLSLNSLSHRFTYTACS